jgi:protein phosphatase
MSFWSRLLGRRREAAPPQPSAPTGRAPSEVPEPLEMTVSIETDVGCVRANNEDSVLLAHPANDQLKHTRGTLIIVADGMGGHSSGEVASRMTVELLQKVYYEAPGSIAEALAAAIANANAAVYGSTLRDPQLAGMGTTCTAVAICEGSATLLHVGDSRCYLLRGGATYQLSEDHSHVAELVRRGEITREAARTHEDRNVISKAVGTRESVEPDIWNEPFQLRAGDCLLLCTDGLHDLVSEQELAATLGTHRPAAASLALVELAKRRGGHDNISVAVLAFEPAGPRDAKPVTTREFDLSKLSADECAKRAPGETT